MIKFLLLQMYAALAAKLEENAAYVYKKYVEEEDYELFGETWGAARKCIREPLEEDEHPLQQLRDITPLLETQDERFEFALQYLTDLQYASAYTPPPMSSNATNVFV